MKQLFFILFLTLSFLIQSTIETKSKKKSPSKKQLPSYVQCSKPIRYHFQNATYDRYYVQSTINEIEKRTFLKFKKENNSIKDIGINFYVNSKEDKVELSYDDKKPTVVNLTEKTYADRILTRFFFGYALGLIPELARKDRDSDVKVFEKNISDSYKKYYEKKSSYPESYYATGFDFGSVMLAKPFFGNISKNKRTYMSKFYPHYENQISNFYDLSFNDYKRLNLLYCKDKCKSSKKCAYSGYYGNTCKSCTCFLPFTGQYCTSYDIRSPECGKDITIKAYSSKKTKTVKNFNGKCFYIIEAKNSKKKVKLTIEKFKINSPYSHSLYIRYRKDKGAEGLLIEKNVTNLSLPALSNSVIINFYSYDKKNELVLKYQEVKK
uniref:Metalloendopeptidase n=1 Tax=Strongyloides papillosus TaxID=174720 RepID=A0A0N5BU53_STREA